MPFNFDIINIFILIVVTLNSSLGLFIYISKKSSVNRNFFIFSLAATGWGLSMLLFRTSDGTSLSVLSARILYASAATIPFVFLFFIRIFPEEKFTIPVKYAKILLLPFLAIIYICLAPNLLISGTLSNPQGEQIIYFNKLFHTIYAFYIMSSFSVCYGVLFYKYFNFNGVEKIQTLYVLLGTLVATLIGVTTNLIMPYFDNFQLNWMGQIGIIAMIGSISYSILQHKLFDIKVVAAQFIVFILCTSQLARLLLASNQTDKIIDVSFLTITIIIGTFLIRSVIKEVRLREQIEKLAEDLKHSNDGQASLIHFMNHQVKGKFGNARNIFAELLTDDYGVMPDTAKPLLEKGLEETKKGVDYVQNILKGASAESGNLPYDMQPMNYRRVVEDIISKQKEIAETKGLRFDFQVEDGKFDILGDALQLTEATRNLIDNSINYTQEGSIEVHLRDDGNMIRLTIHDTGIGLSDDDKTKLFKSGGRGAESVKINVNSTGYGLVFVKGVIQAHKGRVWAESEGRGRGSTFVLEIPQRAA